MVGMFADQDMDEQPRSRPQLQAGPRGTGGTRGTAETGAVPLSPSHSLWDSGTEGHGMRPSARRRVWRRFTLDLERPVSSAMSLTDMPSLLSSATWSASMSIM